MALRFFRKHRKWFMILVFAAVISMVFWLAWREVAGKLSAWFASLGRGEVVGRIAGREVTDREVGRFAGRLQIAGRAAQRWYQGLVQRVSSREAAGPIYLATVDQSAWPLLARQVEDPERIDRATALVWLALYEEARRFGFGTTQMEVEARLDRLRSLGLTDGAINQTVVREAYGRRDLLLEALADDMTLADYIRYLYETFSVPVTPEVRRAFAKQDARIKVRLAVFKADEVTDEVQEPTEDVLREYFAKYKAYLPGKGPEGIGYRIPPKVAVEYLVAEPDAFEDEAAEAVTAEEVKAYYEANKDPEFLIEKTASEAEADADEAADTADADEAAGNGNGNGNGEAAGATGGEASTSETGREPAEPDQEPAEAEKAFRPLEEVRGEIRRRLVRQKAEDLAHEHLGGLVGEITTKRKGVDLRIWADGTRVRYVGVPGRHTAEELAEVPGLGGAARGRVAVPQVALNVVELVGPEKARIAVREISEVYTGSEGKAYVFRVTDVAPSREPKDLDEVRRAVLKDVVLARAFRLARERAKRLLEAAAEKGLETAADEAEVETVPSDWFPRQRSIPYQGRWLEWTPSLPEVDSSRVLVDECFRMVEDGRERTLVSLGKQKMVVVAELIGRKAPREAAYAAFRPMVVRRVAQQMAGRAVPELLEPGAVRRRMAVVEVSGAKKETGETETDTADDPATLPEEVAE